MKFLKLCCMMLLWIGLAYGQPKTQSAVVHTQKREIQKDTALIVSIRKFDEKAIAAYREQKAFDYGEKVARGKSWWQLFMEWIESLFPKSEKKTRSKPNGVVAQVLIVVLTIMILFAIVKISKLDLLIFAKKSKKLDLKEDEIFEDIHQIQFDDQIAIALQQQNYRLAVRLRYLATLKELSDRGLIDWQVNKTNQQYVAELNGLKYKEAFGQLTHQFEYVWYGDFQIGPKQYELINTKFVQFNQLIS